MKSVMFAKLFTCSSLAALALTGACSLEDEEADVDDVDLSDVEQHTICGPTDDSQWVNDYNGTLGPSVSFVAANKATKGALASGSASSNSKYCSGTLISANTFLTAGHCVDSTTVGDYAVFNYERAAGSTALLTQSPFRVDAVLEDAVGGVDYAIVRLAGSPGTTFGIATVASADPATGAAATIIGHPQGLPKKIEAGTISSFSGNTIRYGNIDTLGGNSGSGIIDSQGRVIGVHTNGGCTASGGVNYGMRISRIRAVSSIL
jgi:V8-like Glu-specific endopeptidase